MMDKPGFARWCEYLTKAQWNHDDARLAMLRDAAGFLFDALTERGLELDTLQKARGITIILPGHGQSTAYVGYTDGEMSCLWSREGKDNAWLPGSEWH